jgi:P-type Ca2+ transporter type 2C
MNVGPLPDSDAGVVRSTGEPGNRILSESPHSLTIDQLLKALRTNPLTGLEDAEVSERRRQFGLNRLAEAAPVPRWRLFLEQFRELVIWILLAAAVIAGVTGEWIDTLAIAAIVFLNAVIGYMQEERAGRSLAAVRGEGVALWRYPRRAGERLGAGRYR